MKQRKRVVHSVRVEHTLFRSSRKRQCLETGSYTLTASSESARFQWLLRSLEMLRKQDFKKRFTKT